MSLSNIKLSIVIPCYNEENYIKNLIEELFNVIDPFEVIIVDDKSNDKSVEIVESINNPKLILIKNQKNHGKGYCLRKGFNKAQGDVIVIQDADPEYSPYDIKMLVEPFTDANTILVIGTNFKQSIKERLVIFITLFLIN